MSLKIYNSLSQTKETFEPIEPGKIKMYVCGITAYDECHLGHARAGVVFDLIYRYLQHLGYEVTYVRNFTDVDDKIIKKSQETGVSCDDITAKYMQSYLDQMAKLQVQSPTEQPRATQHIDEMVALVQQLEVKGLAYASGGDVFYSIRKLPDYGKLSHKKIDDLESGSRVEVDAHKKDPLDFVLWKAAKPGEPKWASPWGEGRPGWHLECSAMSMKYLGESFDIHGGGRDLIFPHHENEIAQSEGVTEKCFSRYWIHNGFVNINAEKMSKSLGNIRSIPAILEQWDWEVVRYFLLSAHYATPLDFTDKAMSDAEAALKRCYEALLALAKAEVGTAKIEFDFASALSNSLNDDFNTSVITGEVFKLVRQINSTLATGEGWDPQNKADLFAGMKLLSTVLGVFGSEPAAFLARQKQLNLNEAALDAAEIEALIAERIQARADKNWARSDEIRDSLAEHGIILKDNPDGTTTWSV